MKQGRTQQWVAERVASNSLGQQDIFIKQHMNNEWQEFCDYIDEVLGVKPDREVPEEDLRKWLSACCKSRKTKDDWTGMVSLYRNFTGWLGESYSFPAFEMAIQAAGYAVHRGMVSKLVLKEDHRWISASVDTASMSTPICSR